MIYRLTPHTPEWFVTLKRFDIVQADHTAPIVSAAGSNDVCTVCGDTPALAFEKVRPTPVEGSVATLRLCDDCREMRENAGECFIPFVC